MTIQGIDKMINSVKDNQHSKEELQNILIVNRLNKSLDTYTHEIQISLDYLERRKDQFKLLKKINKLEN